MKREVISPVQMDKIRVKTVNDINLEYSCMKREAISPVQKERIRIKTVGDINYEYFSSLI